MAGDANQRDELIALGNDPRAIARVQELAKDLMQATGNGHTLRLACAATLSCFLNEAGIPVVKTVGAGNLARRLEDGRGWQRVDVGDQMAGDVGVTVDADPSRPGADHVYLVAERLDSDLMFIADNQVVGRRHHRTASGARKGAMRSGKTRTAYFLRPLESAVDALAVDGGDAELPDIDTNQLKEPFDETGVLIGFAPSGES